MSLFSGRGRTHANIDRRLYGFQIQTSLYGNPIPALWGTRRIPGNVIWTGDWKADPIKQGGKGILGKGSSGSKGGGGGTDQQYDYKTSLEIGIVQGPITTLKEVWVDKTKMTLATSSETFTIPGGGGTYNPVNQANFYFDHGVAGRIPYSFSADDYGSPGSASFSGNQNTPFTPVGSSPGSHQYVLNNDGSYTFSAADAGTTVAIYYQWTQPTGSNDGNPIHTLNLVFFDGSFGQAPWAYMTSNHLDQALGYSELCKIALQDFDLGTSGMIPNLSFEVASQLLFGGGIVDVEPSVILSDFWTNLKKGMGLPSNTLGDLTGMSNYCRANGIFISMLLDQQRTGADIIRDLLTIANCEGVYGDGVLKIRTRGDTTAIGNGAQFTPDTAPVYDLDDDDFLGDGKTDPVIIIRPTVRDSYNHVPLEWTNRGNSYNVETIDEKNDWAISQYGLRTAAVMSLHDITTHAVAATVANTELKKLVYLRNQYEFTIGWQYVLLEAMDMVTITDVNLGLVKQPVRLISVEEDDKGQLKCIAEEFPWGTAKPTIHPKQVTGSFGPGFFAEPGNTYAPIFFEAPPELTQDIQFQLFIGLAGGSNWGGSQVWISTDGGNSYVLIGTQYGPTTRGFLTATLAAGVDPDVTHTLAVDLTESGGALTTFSQAQADNFVSLVLVDQELIAYQTASLTGSNQYNLTYLRRGCFGTPISAHATSAPFMVLDKACFVWEYDTSDVGQTRDFKFTSFNKANQQEQPLANVADYSHRVVSPRLPYPWKPGFSAALFMDPRLNFSCSTSYVLGTDGVMRAQVQIVGNPSLNVPSKLIGPPTISCVVATTGGSIPGNQKLLVAVQAWDAASNPGRTKLSNIVPVTIPAGTNTNKITITITWPANNFGGEILMASPAIDDELTYFGVSLTTSQASVVVTDISTLGAWQVPSPVDQVTDHRVFRTQLELHAGVWGGQIVAVDNINSKVTINATFTQNFAGRYLTLLGHKDSTNVDCTSYLITSNTGNTLTLNIGTDSFIKFNVGDVVAIRTKASTHTATQIGDSLFVNDLYPGGLSVSEAGHTVRLIFGTGAGQERKILSNTTTVYTVDKPFSPAPDATTVFIVLSAVWYPDQPGKSYASAAFVSGLADKINLPNLPNTYFIEGLNADKLGITQDESLAVFRELYIFGQSSGYFLLAISANAVTPDLANGLAQEVVLNQATQVTINDAIWTGGNLQPGVEFSIIVVQDATGARPSPAWGATYVGVAGFQIDGTASTYSQFRFKIRTDGRFQLHGTPLTGVALT